MGLGPCCFSPQHFSGPFGGAALGGTLAAPMLLGLNALLTAQFNYGAAQTGAWQWMVLALVPLGLGEFCRFDCAGHGLSATRGLLGLK